MFVDFNGKRGKLNRSSTLSLSPSQSSNSTALNTDSKISTPFAAAPLIWAPVTPL